MSTISTSFFLFLFFFFSLATSSSNFTFCSTPPTCNPIFLALADIANSFQNKTKIATYWNFTKEKNFCFWPGVICDISRNITAINLYKRNFMGTISPSFSNITTLQGIYLENNNLTGQIPQTLTKLTQLRYLYLSYNNLSGPIPIFNSSVQVIITGNPLLDKNTSTTMPPMSSTQPPINSMPPITTTRPPANRVDDGPISNKQGRLSLTTVILIIACGVFSLLVGCSIIACTFFLKRRHQGQEGLHPSFNQEGLHYSFSQVESVLFSYQLLSEATNNFDEQCILGRGASGVVYRGELHNGIKVAIKKINSVGVREFQAEVDVLSRVTHRHLVKLLAHCVHGNELFLVYEYMSQGTLTQHLFHWQRHGYSPLTWKERILIASDVARGVQFLHSLAHHSFIHRDLKPSNILLDDNLRAKIADFGLVRRAPEELASVETRVAGTFGYLDPEYVESGRVTARGDVYAFGAILMELMTGRKALDMSRAEEEVHLVTWLCEVLKNNNQSIQSLIDPTLNPDEETMESIEKVIELARHCTIRNRHDRPDINHVVNVIDSLIHQWTPAIPNHVEEQEIALLRSLSELALRRWEVGEGTSSTFETDPPN